MRKKTENPRSTQKSFRITEDAAEEILQSMSQTNPTTGSLRIAAKRRPDGSIDYAMGFDEADDTDTVLEQYSVEVLIGVTSLDLLAGALLDCVRLETNGAKEFIFLNPNDPQFVPPDAKRADRVGDCK